MQHQLIFGAEQHAVLKFPPHDLEEEIGKAVRIVRRNFLLHRLKRARGFGNVKAEGFADQILPRLEIIGEGAQGHARFIGHAAIGERIRPACSNQPERGIEDFTLAPIRRGVIRFTSLHVYVCTEDVYVCPADVHGWPAQWPAMTVLALRWWRTGR